MDAGDPVVLVGDERALPHFRPAGSLAHHEAKIFGEVRLIGRADGTHGRQRVGCLDDTPPRVGASAASRTARANVIYRDADEIPFAN
ncbi:hypothetical protein BVIR_1694 [Blastochloris viridis]|uniref:Uncharacterized protein n=2 Tax=Blastochloris viridis TaxID=1079 RepID=A0A0N7IUI7_BLAVI|nr:hypothetical protein BVIR_1694 [Blastochloris viridis]CUU42133.1 hypothetical protein BVIRIDIS_11390 [Blastochloris viridis]